jgi:hypothetical protein
MGKRQRPRDGSEPSIGALALIGAAAGATSKTTVAPIERVRLLLQMAHSHGTERSGLNAILEKEGAFGLFRGNGLAVIRATLSKGTLFAMQDVVARRSGSDAFGGSVAGLAAGALTYPLDLLRARIAGSLCSGTLRAAVADLWAHSGSVLVFYRGYPPTMVGAVTYEGVRFGIYGHLRDEATPERSGVMWAALYGMTASLVAGNFIYPNDTIRRRLQAANAPGESYFGAAAALWREGGAARLYRGCLLYNLKAAPSAAVQFATYNGLKSLLPLLADGPAPKHAPKPVARAPAASAGAGAGVSDAVLVAEGPAGAPKRMQLARYDSRGGGDESSGHAG